MLPPSEHHPQRYLRGYHSAGQTRMEYLMARAANAIGELS
jgi:hypothetical protein